MNRTVAALAVALSCLFTASSAFSADDPSGEDQPSVRSASAPTAKSLDIGGTGSLDYSYELEMPKFHGIEPKIVDLH